MRYGWRASFLVFGVVGAIWAMAWYLWFRDTPAEMPGVSAAELSELSTAQPPQVHSFPWRLALRSETMVATLGVAFCYIYVYTFFQTWFHTFLVRGRGFGESSLFLSALPYALAACANLAGGAASDALVRRFGRTWGRRSLGLIGLGTAGLCTVGVMLTRDPILTIVLLSFVYGGITFQQPGVFGVCLDVGRQHAGSIVGLMNTAAQVGGLAGALAYGYIVQRFGSYDAPFVPMAALLFVGALLWLKVDAAEEVRAAAPAVAVTA
jgi:predicted MFS family arabinose efflux permease